MKVIQTEDKSFVRDLHSKALINTDRVALENHRKKRQMEIKVEELNNMRTEILEIKGLLQEVLNKKEL